VKNVTASVLARLRNVAQNQSASFSTILQTYCNERFLARVAESDEAGSVLLKGAQMLRVWGIPNSRPTMDIDLLRRGKGDLESLVKLVKRWAEMKVADDGVVFDPNSISAESIRDDTDYVGTRIRLNAKLDNVREKVQIDFGVGDAVHPAAVKISYPVLLGAKPITLHAYPAEASIAEKVHAMVDLDMRNSRMKDFYDIWLLSRTLEFSGVRLCTAFVETFKRRTTAVPAVRFTALTERFYEDAAHVKQWAAFRKSLNKEDVPSPLSEVVIALRAFLEEPLVAAAAGKVFSANWKPPGPWQA
jgi:hypothetical protein